MRNDGARLSQGAEGESVRRVRFPSATPCVLACLAGFVLVAASCAAIPGGATESTSESAIAVGESAATESAAAPTASAPETPAAPEPGDAPYVEDPTLSPPVDVRWEDYPDDAGTKLLLLWEPSPDDPGLPQRRPSDIRRDWHLRMNLSTARREAEQAAWEEGAAKREGVGYVIRRKPSARSEFYWGVPRVPSAREGEGEVADEGLPAQEEVPSGSREYVDSRFVYLDPVGEDAELKADNPAPFEEVKILRERRAQRDPSRTSFDYEIRFVKGGKMSPPVVISRIGPRNNYYNTQWTNVLVVVLVSGGLILGFIYTARSGRRLYVRPIGGLQAVDDAVGRATEMGRPVLFCAGFGAVSDIPTIAAMVLLGRIARIAAEHGTDLIVPCRDPVVMTALREVVKEAYLAAGKPEDFREDRIYFLTDAQFAYAAGMAGIMVREKTATNFYFGSYFAESLILTEAGFIAGSIQIVGTDSFTQLPFFVTTCDFTLMGEEFYGASAYLSREPKLLGSLKGQDYSKLLIAASMVVGLALATVFFVNKAPGVSEWIKSLFHFSLEG